MIDPLALGVFCAALLVACIAQRVVGLGFGLVMAPVAALVAGPIAALPLNAVFSVIACSLMLPGVWRDIDWRRMLWLLVPAVVASIPGLLLARAVSPDSLRIAVGLITLGGVVVSVALQRTEHRFDGPLTRTASGAAIGVMNAAVTTGAPAVGIYSLVSRWDPRPFSASMQPFWVGLGLVTIAERQLLVPDGWPEWPWWAWLAGTVAAVVGTLFAHPIAHRVRPGAARWAVVVLSLLGGTAIIWQGVQGIMGA